ncbi:Serine/threonine-protein phosphatase 7 long form homolog, partial [Linum perenne]
MTHTCRNSKKIVDYDPRFESILSDTGLDSLRDALKLTPDPEIITALVERWRPETNTFHLYGGEVTITLEDVHFITGLSVDGLPVTSPRLIPSDLDELFAYWEPWVGFEGHSPQTFVAYRVVTPLICYFSVMWHRPDRVLRQFGMDQPLPTFDMPRSEVMINLETTQRGTRQADWVA